MSLDTGSGTYKETCATANRGAMWTNPTNNVMSYADDSCGAKLFSNQQIMRMRCCKNKN
jgi:hypothetical protein